MSAKKTIALISGSNQGIGLATALQLARDHGYHVIIGARNAEAGKKAAEGIVAEGYSASSVQLDLDSDESIKAAIEGIESEYGVLDVLVNNAGILIDVVPGWFEDWKHLTTRELFTKTFNTNVTGTACLTEACLPLLKKAELPRIVFVSSIMGSIEKTLDKTTQWYNIDYKVYDSSKAAENMLACQYVRILDGKGLVNVVCPGLIKSNLTKFAMGEEPEVGAKQIVKMATLGKDGPTGTYSNMHGSLPW